MPQGILKQPGATETLPVPQAMHWSKAPFEGLKNKLDNLSTLGTNNPCAAAAFRVRDFTGVGGLVPRILVLTSGARKCVANEVFKSIKESGSKSHPVVDVVTIGNHRKTSKGYSILAAKTGGVFLRVEKPVDVNVALSRYQEILTARTLEKIEVRGRKTVLAIGP